MKGAQRHVTPVNKPRRHDQDDDVVIDEDFSATTVTLNADHSDGTADDWDKNGNLLHCYPRHSCFPARSFGCSVAALGDADYKYTYDAWQRMVKVTSKQDSDITIQTAAYDGLLPRLPLERLIRPLSGGERRAFVKTSIARCAADRSKQQPAAVANGL